MSPGWRTRGSAGGKSTPTHTRPRTPATEVAPLRCARWQTVWTRPHPPVTRDLWDRESIVDRIDSNCGESPRSRSHAWSLGHTQGTANRHWPSSGGPKPFQTALTWAFPWALRDSNPRPSPCKCLNAYPSVSREIRFTLSGHEYRTSPYAVGHPHPSRFWDKFRNRPRSPPSKRRPDRRRDRTHYDNE